MCDSFEYDDHADRTCLVIRQNVDDALEWHLAEVPGAAMSIWSDAANDTNPIHIDPLAAAALGFGHRCVNPGPANLAYVMNMLMDARAGCQIIEVEATFLGNVLAGDHVQAIGKIAPGSSDQCHATLRVMPEVREVLHARIRFEEDR